MQSRSVRGRDRCDLQRRGARGYHCRKSTDGSAGYGNRPLDAYAHGDRNTHAHHCPQNCVPNGRGERAVGVIGFPFSSRAVQAWIGEQQLSLEDRQDTLANLGAIGLKGEAVEFEHRLRYEPSIISVVVESDEFAKTGDAIVDAIGKVVRRFGYLSVRFGLSEETGERAASMARWEAVPGTEEAAGDLANALGLEWGGVIGPLEYRLRNVPFAPPRPTLTPAPSRTPITMQRCFPSIPDRKWKFLRAYRCPFASR